MAATSGSDFKYRVVMVRHGESTWNQENKFTGWTDVPLSETGKVEAAEAGDLLVDSGFSFDVVYTSVLKRAILTMWSILEKLDLHWVPVIKHWRLNERHYGALQGLNKAETAALHGEDQVKIWRRSYDVPPPSLEVSDERNPVNDRRYAGIPQQELPLAESLALTVDRVVPYWDSEIVPSMRSGKNVLIVAHGNSLRALVKHLDNISNEDILELNIPTGKPLVYELDEDLKVVRSYYLGDQAAIQAAMAAVAAQGSSAK